MAPLGLLLGYAFGSIPFGLLLTRAAGLGDIRAIGSGNIGATNVLRTGRRGLAAATLLLDGGKGAAAVLLAILARRACGRAVGRRRGGAGASVSRLARLSRRQGRCHGARRAVGRRLAGRAACLRDVADHGRLWPGCPRWRPWWRWRWRRCSPGRWPIRASLSCPWRLPCWSMRATTPTSAACSAGTEPRIGQKA